MIGRLVLDRDRPDIVSDTGALYGGLHCGDCFQCWMNGQWSDVRLEYAHDWILIHDGDPISICYGVPVRI